MTEIPKVYGEVHKTLSSCSNSIDISYDKSKGRLLYAKKNIKPGSVLIVDHPFSFSTNIDAQSTNCLLCHVSLKLPHIISVPCQYCQVKKMFTKKLCYITLCIIL